MFKLIICLLNGYKYGVEEETTWLRYIIRMKISKLPSGMSSIDVYYKDITHVIFIHGNT